MIIVGLVEEDVFSIFALNVGCVVFKDSFGINTVLSAELFPELRADCIKSRNYFDFRIGRLRWW